MRCRLPHVFALLLIAVASLDAQSPQLIRLGGEFAPDQQPNAFREDFDGDGDIDFLTLTSSYQGAFSVRLNDGAGRFVVGPQTAWPTLSVLSSFTIGDFDGDADPDVAYVNSDGFGAYRLDYMDNLGGGAFLPRGGFLYAAGCGLCGGTLSAFDSDGDGDDDLLLLSQFGPSHFYINQGGWNFLESVGALPTFPYLASVAPAGDIDGDGDEDCYMGGGLDGVVRFLRSDGAVLTVASSYDVGPAGSSSALGDYDADGRNDLAIETQVGASYAPAVRTIVSFATGLPVVLQSVPVPVRHYRLAAIDVDGDGLDELAGLTDQTIEIFASGSAVPTQIFPATIFAGFVTSFDVDSDGDDDLLYRSLAGHERLLRNRGDWTFVDVAALMDTRFQSTSSGCSELLDHDGDGLLDLCGATRSVVAPGTTVAGPMNVVLNDGIGGFPTYLAPNAAAGAQEHLAPTATADFDGDGRDDFAFVQGGQLRVRYSDGVGGFSTMSVPTGGFGDATAIAAADVDSDGLKDVVVALQTGALGSLRWFKNLASTGFAAAVTLRSISVVLPNAPMPDLAAFDADQDGDVDLLIPGSNKPELLINNGVGLFATTFPFGVFSASTVAAGDIDADGDMDVVLGDRVRIRTGLTYAVGPNLAAGNPTASSSRRRLVDLDADGKADLLAVDEWRPALASGAFGAGVPIEPLRPQLTAANVFWQVGDVDRDGDLDLWDCSSSFRWNLLRHLSRGSAAALGRTGTLDVRGPAGAPYELFASLPPTAGPVVLGSWGLLHLDLDSAFPVSTGLLSAGGTAEVAFAIPDLASLEGLALYWQSALPSVGRLTGAVHTVIYRY